MRRGALVPGMPPAKPRPCSWCAAVAAPCRARRSSSLCLLCLLCVPYKASHVACGGRLWQLSLSTHPPQTALDSFHCCRGRDSTTCRAVVVVAATRMERLSQIPIATPARTNSEGCPSTRAGGWRVARGRTIKSGGREWNRLSVDMAWRASEVAAMSRPLAHTTEHQPVRPRPP